MHLHLKTNAAVPIGTIIKAVGPPDSTWLKCDGSILNQADYAGYVAEADDLHPRKWTEWDQFEAPDAGSSMYRYGISIMGTTVVCVGRGNVVWVSTDSGETWTSNTNLGSSVGYKYGLINNGTYFVAGEYNTSNPYYSTDGVTWTQVTGLSITDDYWKFHAYGNGTFMIMSSSYSGSPSYITSTNGTTWTARTGPWTLAYPQALFFDGSEFLVYASDSGPTNCKLYRSSDAITWTSPSGTIQDFMHGNPYYNQLEPKAFLKHDGDLYMLWGDWAWALKYVGTEKTNPTHWEPVQWLQQRRDNMWYLNDTSSGHGLSIGDKCIVIPRSSPQCLIGKSFEQASYHALPFDGAYCCTTNGTFAIAAPYSGYWRNIVKSSGIHSYDDTTKFQLPNYAISEIARINYYIKVSE